jgi:hypothetical protein
MDVILSKLGGCQTGSKRRETAEDIFSKPERGQSAG